MAKTKITIIVSYLIPIKLLECNFELKKCLIFLCQIAELFCDRILSYAIPRNHSGVSAGTHSQTSTVVTSTPSELGSQYLSSQKAYTEFEGNFKLITRGIVSLATGLSHNKEVKDFFVQLVEKV